MLSLLPFPHPTCSHYCRSCLLFALLARETGSVLCGIALLECFGDAVTSAIGHYDVALGGTGSKCLPEKTRVLEFDTTPTQSQA